MIGETANGRSTSPSASARPQNFWRTRTSANASPNRVLTTVARIVIPIVRPNDRRASADIRASQNGPNPPSRAFFASASVGIRIRSANQPTTTPTSSRPPQSEARRRSLAMTAPSSTLDQIQGDQDPQRRYQEHDR